MLKLAKVAEEIAATSSKLKKIAILAAYLRGLKAEDLRLAVLFLSGRTFPAASGLILNLGWAAMSRALEQVSGLTPPAMGEIYRRYQEPGEAAFDALDGKTQPKPTSLRQVEQAFRKIATGGGAAGKQEVLAALLRRLDPLSAKYVIKVVSGELRIGLQEGLIEEAIAEAFGVSPKEVRRTHMLTGDLAETAVLAQSGGTSAAAVELFKPIRFMLAAVVPTPEEAMEKVQAPTVWTEEKYDGVRCQLHRDKARVALYSRDLKETTAAFPEVAEAATRLEHELLIDGEILAHRDGKVLRFFELQRRLGRKEVSSKLLREVPVVLVAFDLIRLDGESLLDHPLEERRARLEALDLPHPFLLARKELAKSAQDLERIFNETRERGNEGLMIKDPKSFYTPGRRGAAWLKLKRPLATLDVVVTAVEWGHGKRRGVLSDYTFAVLDTTTQELVNVGKAYSGLTDKEIAHMTEHFQKTTVADHGWRREVKPDTVIEVAFDSIQHSGRHRSGYALRFPRIIRFRDDKQVSEIDTIETVRTLYDRFFGSAETATALAEVAEPG